MKLSTSEKLFLKAYHYNWDDGIKPLNKIITNKDCDKATALLIYWLARPEYYNKYNKKEELPEYELPSYNLIKQIERLVLEGKFLEKISFQPDPSGIPAELGNIPSEMTQGSKGEINSTDLIEKNVGELKLLKACTEGDLDSVKDLIEKSNFNPDEKINGSLPIELAVIYGHIETVKYLISKGVNIKVKTGPSGFTLHHWACQSKHLAVSELLCKEGLNIDAKGKWKRTALHQNVYWEDEMWMESKMERVLLFLLEQGADPNLKDVDGLNAFDLAEKAENKSALNVLKNAK